MIYLSNKNELQKRQRTKKSPEESGGFIIETKTNDCPF